MRFAIQREVFLALAVAAAPLSASAQPTYSKEISRLIQQNCQMCHRPGDISFPLMTYQDAATNARKIRENVVSRLMPPWKPVPGHGVFKGDRRLSDHDLQTFVDWVDAGFPEGNPNDLPPSIVYTDQWRLGYPDQVLAMPLPYTPSSVTGTHDRYRCFVIPSAVDQDRWVRAVDIVPEARQQVHHALLYLTDDAKEIAKAQQLDAADPDPGYDCWGGPLINPGAGPGLIKELGGILGGWVPGAAPVALPDDIGMLVPKGSYVILQVHYNLANVPDPLPDRTQIGLYFETHLPKNRLLVFPMLNDTFVLQPGDLNRQVDISFSLDIGQFGVNLPQNLVPTFSAVRIGPHMHQLGQHIKTDMIEPDGATVPLIQIDGWDFNWQGFYDYVKPVPIPYKSTFKSSCWFDNTTNRVVRWGESTQDEMCVIYFGFIADGGIAPLLFGNPGRIEPNPNVTRTHHGIMVTH